MASKSSSSGAGFVDINIYHSCVYTDNYCGHGCRCVRKATTATTGLASAPGRKTEVKKEKEEER